jgi:hypothetical protein
VWGRTRRECLDDLLKKVAPHGHTRSVITIGFGGYREICLTALPADSNVVPLRTKPDEVGP